MTEWSTLGCPTRNTPTHCYSPEGGPEDKASPTNLHILSLFLLLDLTRQLPAFFVGSCQQKQLTVKC